MTKKNDTKMSDDYLDLKPENTGESRNEKGQFKPGVSGNPFGKPEGAGISVVTEIKRKLKEVPEGQKATYLELFINRYFKKAIQDGDVNLIKDLINRVDGMPTQSTDLTTDGEKLDTVVIYIPKENKE